MAGSHSKRNSVRISDSAPAISPANAPKDRASGRIRDVSQSYCPRTVISLFPAPNGRTPCARPRLRHWTVGYRHPYVKPNYTYPTAPRRRPDPPPVPLLPLQGRWLHKAGFTIGTPVRILVMPGRLVLEVDDIQRET
jgi:Toxin SymE, type I toxin-antitoxin system